MKTRDFISVAATVAAWALCVGLRAETVAGADFSLLPFFESHGVVYTDGGQQAGALAILKKYGVNCVRLRLFTSSAQQAAADPYNSINNLDYTVPLAVRVKQVGLRFWLDFHFSDTWADPGHQSKPAAWTNLAFADLQAQMTRYSSNCIAAFNAAGAMPDYVQIGNEITGGLLWPDGRVGGSFDNPVQWSKLGNLIKAAAQGVRDAAGSNPPKIMIHIDRGGDWAGTQWFFDNLLRQQVDFDIIGESYYPFWHGPLDHLSACLTNAVTRYNKPVIVAETAFPWTASTNIFGIPASPDGQVDYAATLAEIVKSAPNNLGLGVAWWGSEYQRLSGYGLAGFDTRSFFDHQGNALPVIGAIGQWAAPLNLSVELNGANAVLKWPLSGAGLSLVMSGALGPSAVWSPAPSSVSHTGAVFEATVPVDGSQSQFYRLQSK